MLLRRTWTFENEKELYVTPDAKGVTRSSLQETHDSRRHAIDSQRERLSRERKQLRGLCVFLLLRENVGLSVNN